MATQLFQPPHGSLAWLDDAIARSQDRVFSETILLTPMLANELLKNNEANRHVSPLVVQQYASDVRGQRWSLNGEPIIVAKNGQMNDGQHRCLAVIDANEPIEVVITFGVTRESQATVDTGKKRTVADIAGMRGVPNAALASAISRMAIAFERSNGRNLHASKEISSAENLDRAQTDAAVAEAATYATSHSRYCKQHVGGSAIGFCFYILTRIHRNDAKAYLDQVCIGEGIKRNDPAHSVRERLLNEGKQRDKKVAIILRGWTFYKRGRNVGPTSLPATLPFPALFS